MKRITVGLASFGMSGMVFHAPFITTNPGFRLLKIVERSPKGSGRIYPDAEVVTTIEELLHDPEPELIVVNTPDHTHFGLSRKALLAGKHVIVEKPFTLTSREGEELIRLAEERNVVLTVFHNRRWDGDFLTVRKVVAEGKLGRLVEFESHYDRYRNYIQPDTWKEDAGLGTGIVYNLGPHMIDQALVLFGMPGMLYADLRIQRDGGKVNDYYDIQLHYERLKVILKSSYLVKEPGPRYILYGTNGSFIKYGIDPQEEALKNGEKPMGETWGREEESEWGILNWEKEGKHRREKIETLPGNYHAYYDSVYSAIRDGQLPAVKSREALDVIRIIEAAIQSSQEKRMITL